MKESVEDLCTRLGIISQSEMDEYSLYAVYGSNGNLYGSNGNLYACYYEYAVYGSNHNYSIYGSTYTDEYALFTVYGFSGDFNIKYVALILSVTNMLIMVLLSLCIKQYLRFCV